MVVYEVAEITGAGSRRTGPDEKKEMGGWLEGWQKVSGRHARIFFGE